jgi:hypothetical protein
MSSGEGDSHEYEVGWDLHVGPEAPNGFRWQIQTDHPLWIPLAARGRATTAKEAEVVARTTAARCTEAARVYLQRTGMSDVRFGMLTVFPDAPAGGGLAVGRLAMLGAPGAVGADRWLALEGRAVDWQTRGGRQTFVTADLGDEESGWRLRELFGCMGALGEQLALACAAMRDLEAAVAAPDSPRSELVRRAWVEHVMHWTMAAGHMFQSVAGRAVALDPTVRPHLLSRQDATSPASRARALGTVFPQESDQTEDWPTFNKTHANYVRRAAAASQVPEVRAIGTLLHGTATDRRWVAMSGFRGEAFHRWRAQTAGVSTMTRRMTRIVGVDGLLPDGQRPDVRGPEDSTMATDHAEGALGLLEESITEFDRLLPGLLKALTSTIMHADGLLSCYGTASLVESSPGTGVLVMPVSADGVDQFLATFG